MTTSTHLNQQNLQSPIHPRHPHTAEAPSPCAAIKQTPIQAYVEQAKAKNIIDENGRLLQIPEKISFDKTHKQQMVDLWKQPLDFIQGDLKFSWNFHQFLLYFVPYFVNSFKGISERTTVELIDGVIDSLGKSFWKEQLAAIAPAAWIREIPEESWNFCKTPSRCYHLYVTFAPKSKSGFKKYSQQFRQLVLYLLVVQKLPQQPSCLLEMTQEFEQLIDPKHNQKTPRLQELHQLIHQVTILNSSQEFLEIVVNPQLSLRIRFSCCPSNTRPRLKIEPNFISCDPTFSPQHYQWVHNQFIGNLDLPLLADANSLGQYWADLTLRGYIFNQKEIEKFFSKSLKKIDLQQAFSIGEATIPEQSHARLAYAWNVSCFAKKYHLSFRPQSPSKVNSSLGHFLAPSSKELEHRYTIIQWLASLTSWHPFKPGYLTAPDAAQLSQQIDLWLKQNPDECLNCFAQVLDLLFADLKAGGARWDDPVLIKIYGLMLQDGRFCSASWKLFKLLNKPAEVTDILAVPSWIRHAAATDQLPFVMGTLSSVFQTTPFASLFSEVEKKLLSADSTSIELAVFKTLLTFPEDKILPSAWTSFKQKNFFGNSQQQTDFLISLAPHLDLKSLPYALNHVCQQIPPPPELILCYLNLIVRFSNPQMEAYRDKLIELAPSVIQISSSLASSYPQGYQVLLKITLEQLKTSLASLQAHSKSWWNHFKQLYSCDKTEEKSLHPLLQEAVLMAPFQLYNKDGFAEIFSSLLESLLTQQHIDPILEMLKKLPLDFVKNSIDRAKLIRLLSSLIEKNPCNHSHVRFIKNLASPTSDELPSLLDRLFESYPPVIDPHNVKDVMGYLLEDFSQFVSSKDVRLIKILETVVDHLVSHPHEKELWAKFAILFEALKAQDPDLHSTLRILEKLLSMKNPPLECFKQPIPQLTQRLLDPQKKQLASIYARLLVQTKKTNGLLSGIPGFPWLIEQLQTAETLDLFADLFFVFYPHHQLTLSHALWMGPYLSTLPHHPLHDRLVSFLLGQKQLLFAKVSPILLNFILYTSCQTQQVWEWLLQHSPSDQKLFFNYCKTLDLTEARNLLKDYLSSEANQEHVCYHIHKILSEPLPSLDLVLSLFKLVPLPDIPPEQQPLWVATLASLFHHMTLATMKEPFFAFVSDRLIPLLRQFQTKPRQEIAQHCLRLAVQMCWEEREKDSKKLDLIEALFSNAISLEEASVTQRLYLLLADKEPFHQQCMLAVEKDTPENSPSLFMDYCDHPYLPQPKDSTSLTVWIEAKWDLFKSRLSHVQIANLIKMLCPIHDQLPDDQKTDETLLRLYAKWEALLTSLPPSHQDESLVCETTQSLMKSFSQHKSNPGLVYNHLFLLRNNCPLAKQQIQISYAIHIFDWLAISLPPQPHFIQTALQDLMTHMNSTAPLIQEAREKFVHYLADIIRVTAPDADLLFSVQTLVTHFVVFIWNNSTLHLSEQLVMRLFVAICHIQQHPNLVRIHSFAIDIFKIGLKSKNTTVLKQLTFVLSCYFLTQPLPRLTFQELGSLLQNISYTSVEPLITDILLNPQKLKSCTFDARSLAIARLLHHVQLSPTLDLIEELAPAKRIPPFHPKEDYTLQFLLRSEWMYTLSRLRQHFKNQPTLFHQLSLYVKDLIDEFTEVLLSQNVDDPLMQVSEFFIPHLLAILQRAASDAKLMNRMKVFLQQMLQSDDLPGSQLPNALCLALQTSPASIHPPIQQLILDLFIEWIQIIDLSKLMSKDFDNLLTELSYDCVQSTVTNQLLLPHPPESYKFFTHSLAIARLLRHIQLPAHLSSIEEWAPSKRLRPLNPNEDFIPQLLLCSEWMYALNRLIQYFESKEQPLYIQVVAYRNDLNSLLIELLLSQNIDDQLMQISESFIPHLPPLLHMVATSPSHYMDRMSLFLKQMLRSPLIATPYFTSYQPGEQIVKSLSIAIQTASPSIRLFLEPLAFTLFMESIPLIIQIPSISKSFDLLLKQIPYVSVKTLTTHPPLNSNFSYKSLATARLLRHTELPQEPISVEGFSPTKMIPPNTDLSLQFVLYSEWMLALNRLIDHFEHKQPLSDQLAGYLKDLLSESTDVLLAHNIDHLSNDLLEFFTLNLTPILHAAATSQNNRIDKVKPYLEKIVHSDYGLQLLKSLSETIVMTPEFAREKLERLAFHILTESLKSPHRAVIEYTRVILPHRFFTLPFHTLNRDDFASLVNLIPYKSIQESVNDLCYPINPVLPPENYLFSLAVARLLQHIKPEPGNPPSVTEVEPWSVIPPFNASGYISLQLQIRCDWILALSRLIQNFKGNNTPQFSEKIARYKKNFVAELAATISSLILEEKDYNTYSPYLVKMMHDDLDVILAMEEGFKIAPRAHQSVKHKLMTVQHLLHKKKSTLLGKPSYSKELG